LEQVGREGDTPVKTRGWTGFAPQQEGALGESDCLRVQSKSGGILHPRLNNDGKPIAHKYRKGKTKRTLKRELKELEAVERDAIGDYRTVHL